MKRMNEINNGFWVCLFMWTVLHILSGCTQTEVVDEPQLPQGGKEVQATFHLNVLANRDSQTRSIAFTADGTIETDFIPASPKDTIKTKAADQLPEGEDSRIAHLWIGQYDADGHWIFNQYFSVVTGGKVDVRLKDSGGKKHHVWFVANAGNLGKIDTEAALKEHVLTYSSTDVGLPENQLCGMTGMWNGVINDGGVESIHVDLTRLVAKISFAYLTGGMAFSFTPTSVTLNSVPDRYQIEAPSNQLITDVTYKTYSGTANRDGATMYWYLPENMAGTVSGENSVESEKKKTGKGVTNVTYIELTGAAVQSGVTYENVSFRFYPGSGKNNYDIVRNSHYTMNVTLAGIDITDERITVGTIPPVEITPGNMPAGIGGEKELQITARPGQEWVIRLPDWLSALIKGKDMSVPTGGSITYQGPAELLFKAETANPKAETRSFSFPLTITGEEQTIEIVQDGSTLEAGSTISLGAASGSEGSSTFTATKGLPWRAVLSDGSWLGWAETNPATSGDAATGEKQNLIVRATSSNPYAKERPVTITVEGGESVGSMDYHNLQKNISVKQAASTIQGSEVEVEPEAANDQSSSFIATPGLVWVAKVTNGDWISFSGATSGSPTTGSAQSVSFDVMVNPTTSQRSGAITVRAGDETEGPTGVITIKQKASSLTASGDKTTLEATADDSGTLTYQATKGLPLSITHPEWLTLITPKSETATGGEQRLEYRTSNLNLNGTNNKGHISVTAGEMTANVAVEQEASVFSITNGAATIAATGGRTTGSVTATPGLPWTISPETHNGITVSPTNGRGNAELIFAGAANTGADRTGTFTVSVTGASPTRTVTVTAKQATDKMVTIDVAIVEDYRETGKSLIYFPPFNYDGGISFGTTGSDRNGVSSNCSLTKAYSIEVEKSQRVGAFTYANAISQCPLGWRLPTMIELYAIWSKCKGSNSNAADEEAASTALGDKFISDWYWSSSVGSGVIDHRCRVEFSNGAFNYYKTNLTSYVRCVRDL